ncbi:DHA2 family efflux MFS transporter permease subunit [Corynebacterium falsenii]|uniref:DHA2 family efflux MFS transporter permease subunit n=1 Tax=Corynebacterium falsenii TaxID=108486 RepID=UPI001DFE4E6A|nr:DHA2 family efflux MFS transporter permease subunit [Corynebacterium falsenii]HJF12455.1 DHA2 family efflux MFS transporter permease subunit [Corynebacterium falsenii]
MASDKKEQDTVNARLLIGILVAAAFVVILNETTLAVALPVLMVDFGISADVAQWLTTSFMLTMAVVIPMTGFIMQKFTLRVIYITAMATFLAGTIGAAIAPSFAILLLARIVQASGTALVIPLLMTTIVRLVPLERRGSVFGMVTVVIAVAPALGPTFSGVVLGALGWRWIFLLMVPLVVLALVVGVWQAKNFEEPGQPQLDVTSVVLSAVGFAGLVYGLVGLADLADGLPVDRLVILGVAVVVLAVFFRRQVRLQRAEAAGEAASPLLDLRPLGVREYRLSLTFMLLSFSMLFGFIILMPMYAQQVAGMSTVATGLVSLPGGLLMGLLGPAVGRAYDARGTRPLVIPGAVLLAVAMFGFAFLDATRAPFTWAVELFGADAAGPANDALQLTVLALVLNLGLALMFTPLMSNALAAVEDEMAPHAQAILNTFQQVAGGAGTAVFIAIMTFAAKAWGGAGAGASSGATPPHAALGHGIHVAFLVGAGISVVLVACVVLIRFDAKKPLAELKGSEHGSTEK